MYLKEDISSRQIDGFRLGHPYDTGVRSGCSDRDALEISVCVDSDAGESLSCCKDATGPDFLLAFSMLAGG